MLLGHTHPQIVFYLGGDVHFKKFWNHTMRLRGGLSLTSAHLHLWHLQTEWQSEKLFLLKSAVIKRRIISSSFSNAWTREACGGGGVGGGGGLLPSPRQESSKSHLNFHSVPSETPRANLFFLLVCPRCVQFTRVSRRTRLPTHVWHTSLRTRVSPKNLPWLSCEFKLASGWILRTTRVTSPLQRFEW